MKKVTRIVVALFAVAMFAMAIPAQTQRAGNINSVMRTAREQINMITDDGGTIDRVEFDMVRQSKSCIRQLDSRYTYGIIAIGDEARMEDLDMKISRRSGGSWEEVDSDLTVGTTARLTVDPSYTEDYKIEVSVYRFKEGYSVGYYGLIIFHD